MRVSLVHCIARCEHTATKPAAAAFFRRLVRSALLLSVLDIVLCRFLRLPDCSVQVWSVLMTTCVFFCFFFPQAAYYDDDVSASEDGDDVAEPVVAAAATGAGGVVLDDDEEEGDGIDYDADELAGESEDGEQDVY